MASRREPIKVQGHDFPTPDVPRAYPYGHWAQYRLCQCRHRSRPGAFAVAFAAGGARKGDGSECKNDTTAAAGDGWRLRRVAEVPKRRFKGKDRIALRGGKVLNRYKVGKHFVLDIGEESFSYQRQQERIEQEAALDGIYVIRTNLACQQMAAEPTVAAYKGLSVAERAFRSCKSVDLKVRPIYHHLENRVRAHVFLCMLAYYVEWHMRQKLAPILFDDEDPEAGRQLRDSVVAPSQRSPQALRKAHRKRTDEGDPVHSFQTLLSDLATISKNRIQPQLPGSAAFDKITRPTSLQQRALDLLGVRL